MKISQSDAKFLCKFLHHKRVCLSENLDNPKSSSTRMRNSAEKMLNHGIVKLIEVKRFELPLIGKMRQEYYSAEDVITKEYLMELVD